MKVFEKKQYLEVRLIEIVRNVPADFSVFPPLLHHSVKEGQHIDQGFESRMWAPFQHVIGDLEVCGSHIQLQPIRRFSHHLQKKKQGCEQEGCLQVARECSPLRRKLNSYCTNETKHSFIRESWTEVRLIRKGI